MKFSSMYPTDPYTPLSLLILASLQPLFYLQKAFQGCLICLSSKCRQLVLILVKHVLDASHNLLQNSNAPKHKLCLNLNKCRKNKKLKLIINNIIRSAWQQEIRKSVISIEEGINNSTRQEESIHILLRSEIQPQRF